MRRVPPAPRSGTPVVALGGGHGLSVTLKALRQVTRQLTAIVGVADDGGSSGRLRAELDVIPPGDLRMALAALCGEDAWGRTWSRVMQHRFTGNGEIAGHATGNLLIAALWQETGDVVEGLDWVAALLGANGRVLPVSSQPLNIVADVKGVDPTHPDQVTTIHGQVELEQSPGQVVSLAVEPADPDACPQAVDAIHGAEVVVMGPGSWYTSVLPHLLVPEIRSALASARARRVLVLNLATPKEQTAGLSSDTYLSTWAQLFSDVHLDVVLADPQCVTDPTALADVCRQLGIELVFQDLTNRTISDRSPEHDQDLLAGALSELVARGTI